MFRPTQAEYQAAADRSRVAFEAFVAAVSSDTPDPDEIARLDGEAEDANVAYEITRRAYGAK